MSDVLKAVLLEPLVVHIGTILRCGPCGAQPPMVTRCPCGLWLCRENWNHVCEHVRGIGATVQGHGALVLAWEGKLVPEGVARAWSVAAPNGEVKTIGFFIDDGPLHDAVYAAKYAEWRGLGLVHMIYEDDDA